jgi:hypothetical protein
VFEVLVPVKNGLFPSLFVENFALACLSLHFQNPVNKVSDVNVTNDITEPPHVEVDRILIRTMADWLLVCLVRV